MSGAYQGSAIEYDAFAMPTAWLRLRDGVELATDVHLPARGGAPAEGPFPALLERTPYHRRRPFLLRTARYFASRGYAVVLQDVRGRYDSTGDWNFLAPEEQEDGCETIAWVASQAWCDGKVGTMGLSFSTANQQALAVGRPPALRTQFLLDGGYSYYHRTARQGGAFELGVMLPYAYRTAREGHELARDREARRRFEAEFENHAAWMAALPFRAGASPLRHAPTYERWFIELQDRGDYDEFWKHPGLNTAEHIDGYPDIPIALEASWYGHHVWATTTKFMEFRARHRNPTWMLLGPWLHGYDDFARTWAGDVDFGGGAAIDINDIRLRWFDRFLKGLNTGIEEGPPVRIFVMGGGTGRRTLDGRLDHGGTWRDEHEWPLARTEWRRWYLHPGGILRDAPPPADAPPSLYASDPSDPVPTVGGGAQASLLEGFIQGGGFDQRGRKDLWACRDTQPLSDRPDVLTFQTPPLVESVEITGPIFVRLWISSSAVDTDFTAKLVDVYPPSEDHPHGYALNLTDGIIRTRYRACGALDSSAVPELMTPDEVYEVAIEPQATSNLFQPGHRIRLDISSSNFPHFDVNPNTGAGSSSDRSPVVAHQTVYHDAGRPSHVVLPHVKHCAA
ncbi:MAG TPA: CocE/NonD family hydrolase [Vicinamibacterales bacterium]|nr:CocE/NonD family hydrolase [Vicinamibacterales bacterium]